jgi:predicted nucleic acid-binding protein
VQLRRLLAGCEVVAFDEAAAHRAGAILARGAGKDVVDASVVDLAIRRGADVVTRDVLDIARLAGAMGARLRLLRP